jgi:hypothetical protein
MRKLTATLATLALAGLGALAPAASVQAAPTAASCDDNYESATSGYMYAYRLSHCESYLGKSKEWDENWGNNSRSFQDDDDNRATSLLNKTGKYVAFYRLKDYKGGHICIASGKKYVPSLKSDDVFSNGETADNRISSHKKLTSNTCSKFMD